MDGDFKNRTISPPPLLTLHLPLIRMVELIDPAYEN